MRSSCWKKALIYQSLFLFQLSFAQNIFIDKPRPQGTLDDTQEFVVSVTDAVAKRVEFYLNGRLIQARAKAPWRFTVSWNTRLENKVRFVAQLEDGTQLSTEQVYAEIRVDVEQLVDEFQFFPFLEEPGSSVQLSSLGKPIMPRTFKPATHFPLNLVVVLDVSGSMKFSLKALSPGLLGLLRAGLAAGWRIQVILFDQYPRLMELTALPVNLEQLYVGRAKSVVWDALATGCELFPKEQRRVILFVSDGFEDGSRHNAESAGLYLRKARAAMIWVAPEGRNVKELDDLAEISGGFTVFADRGEPWAKIGFLLENQYHLLAPDAAFPVNLEPARGKAWYPKWKN